MKGVDAEPDRPIVGNYWTPNTHFNAMDVQWYLVEAYPDWKLHNTECFSSSSLTSSPREYILIWPWTKRRVMLPHAKIMTILEACLALFGVALPQSSCVSGSRSIRTSRNRWIYKIKYLYRSAVIKYLNSFETNCRYSYVLSSSRNTSSPGQQGSV